MVPKKERWIDGAAGPLVRPYTMTRGRTERQQQLDVVTIVIAVDGETPVRGLQPEHNRIRELCAEPHSIVEIAATLQLPLLVTKVLVGDLVDRGCLRLGNRDVTAAAAAADVTLLRSVLEGIRKV